MEDYRSKRTGDQIEALLDIVSQGGGGGGEGGTITEAEITAMGFTKNLGTITGITMNGVSKGTSGVVDLGTIPTAAEVAAKYTKPTEGIPASDLAADVFLQGPKGEDGVGIASVVQTTTSSADGGSNVVTITLSDGKTSTFAVKNGSKGSQGEQGEQGPKGDKGDTGAEGPQGVQGIQGIQGPKGDTGADGAQGPKGDKGDKGDQGEQGPSGSNGTNGKDGADGENGATFTPSVDADGNLSWTNDKGLANPPVVNIKGPKGDAGEGGGGAEGGGLANYPEEWLTIMEEEVTLQPNIYYHLDLLIAMSLDINLESPTNYEIVNEYIFQIDKGNIAQDVTISFPSGIIWKDGDVPTLKNDKVLVVSIVNNLAVYAEF